MTETTSTAVRTERARPLSRDERRDAIAAATVPLLVEHGTAVTTRQIAEAAGVAEGTLFRAFEDKDELLHAAVIRSLEPGPLVESVGSIPGEDLRELVRGLTHLLAEAQRTGMRVFTVAHQVLGGKNGSSPPLHHDMSREQVDRLRAARHGSETHGPDARQRAALAVVEAIEARLAPHARELRVPTHLAAVAVWSLVFGGAMRHLSGDGDLEPDQVADLLLHGIADSSGADRSP